MECNERRMLMDKLTAARTHIQVEYPFYGSLLMHVRFAFADCQTAGTDTKRIIWDPAWLRKRTNEEVQFVLLHEVLHNALQHCQRSKGYNNLVFNIAADIVVNSNILETMEEKEFLIDGEPVMHLTPGGEEGFQYSAEEIYDMLMDKYGGKDDRSDPLQLHEILSAVYGQNIGQIDDHNFWLYIPGREEGAGDAGELERAKWKNYVAKAAKDVSYGYGTPHAIRELLEINLNYRSKTNWRRILEDFIKLCADGYDYTFSPPDRRFQDLDFLLPSFHETEEETIEKLWFLVDTSGSIDDQTLTEIYQEIQAALEQFTHFSGMISCFDVDVTKPVEFDEVTGIRDMEFTGGGGTSFLGIFDYMREHMAQELPGGIVILTDGFAEYPDKKVAMGVPVLWVIVGSEKEVPWGKSIHLEPGW